MKKRSSQAVTLALVSSAVFLAACEDRTVAPHGAGTRTENSGHGQATTRPYGYGGAYLMGGGGRPVAGEQAGAPGHPGGTDRAGFGDSASAHSSSAAS